MPAIALETAVEQLLSLAHLEASATTAVERAPLECAQAHSNAMPATTEAASGVLWFCIRLLWSLLSASPAIAVETIVS